MNKANAKIWISGGGFVGLGKKRMRNGMVVLPTFEAKAGGVSARTAMAAGGIAGGVWGVGARENPLKVIPTPKPRKVEKPAVVEPPKKVEEPLKRITRIEPPKYEPVHECKVTETEKRMAEYLGAAEEAVAEVTKKEMEGVKEEAVMAGVCLPELPMAKEEKPVEDNGGELKLEAEVPVESKMGKRMRKRMRRMQKMQEAAAKAAAEAEKTATTETI